MAGTIREGKKIYYIPEVSKPSLRRSGSVGLFEEHHVVRRMLKKIVFIEPDPVLVNQYYFSGNVYEKNELNPVSGRTVRLYRRSTGELVSSTTSSSSGYFYLETPYSDEHYIIALDDELGIQYNLVAADWMVPLDI